MCARAGGGARRLGAALVMYSPLACCSATTSGVESQALCGGAAGDFCIRPRGLQRDASGIAVFCRARARERRGLRRQPVFLGQSETREVENPCARARPPSLAFIFPKDARLLRACAPCSGFS